MALCYKNLPISPQMAFAFIMPFVGQTIPMKRRTPDPIEVIITGTSLPYEGEIIEVSYRYKYGFESKDDPLFKDAISYQPFLRFSAKTQEYFEAKVNSWLPLPAVSESGAWCEGCDHLDAADIAMNMLAKLVDAKSTVSNCYFYD